MNKTHGMKVSAWMLGSGLLLNATLTAHAQVPTPPAPDEYYAPQPSKPVPAKKAPGLLPSAIRNADSSNSVVRPIAPANNSLGASHKINGMTIPTMKPTNRSTVTPATLQNDSTIEQSDAPLSPIQKQLEELYRKDGRPMPQMNFNQTPVPANGPVPTTGNVNNRPIVAPSNVVPPKPRSFLDKINPFSRSKSAPAPLPQHPSNPIPQPAARAPQMRSNSTPTVNPAGARVMPAPPAAVPAQPAAKALPTNAKPSNELLNTLPPVPGDPGYQGPAASGGEAIAIPQAPPSIDDALDNAFTDKPDEMPEEKIEEQPQEPVDAKTPANESPFGGISLDDEFGPVKKPSEDSAKPKTLEAETPATSEAETPAAEEPAANIPAAESKALLLPEDNTEDLKSDDIPLPPEALPTEPAKDEVDNKMKLIAERGELRGLKGFCPVTLRDERDLRNALPEHHSTYKGRTYYFSSADAKTAFDEHPQHYAPKSGGQDVVLLKEKTTKEGSLDHAVWFKDRLYLFTSQKTLEQFVATPKEFAISE